MMRRLGHLDKNPVSVLQGTHQLYCKGQNALDPYTLVRPLRACSRLIEVG